MGKVNRIVWPLFMSLFLYIFMEGFFFLCLDFGTIEFSILSTLALVIYGKYLFIGAPRGIKGLKAAFIRSWLIILLNTLYFIAEAVTGVYRAFSSVFHSENAASGFDFLILQGMCFMFSVFITMSYFYVKGSSIADKLEKADSY